MKAEGKHATLGFLLGVLLVWGGCEDYRIPDPNSDFFGSILIQLLVGGIFGALAAMKLIPAFTKEDKAGGGKSGRE